MVYKIIILRCFVYISPIQIYFKFTSNNSLVFYSRNNYIFKNDVYTHLSLMKVDFWPFNAKA